MRLFLFFLPALMLGSPLAAEPAKPEAPQGPKFSDLALLGYEKEQAKHYDQAIEAYTRAITIKEDSPTVFVRRAYCAAQLGKVQQMVEDLREADRLPPVTVTDYATM